MPRKIVSAYNDPRVPLAEIWRIIEDICRCLKMPLDEVFLVLRGGTSPRSRRIVVWTLRRVTCIAYPQMSVILKKHHTTLIHADQCWEKALLDERHYRPEMARLLLTVYRAHRHRMRTGARTPAPAMQLEHLTHVPGDDGGRGRYARRQQGEDEHDALQEMAEVAWCDADYRGTKQSFFEEQNKRAVAHMARALRQEQRERG